MFRGLLLWSIVFIFRLFFLLWFLSLGGSFLLWSGLFFLLRGFLSVMMRERVRVYWMRFSMKLGAPMTSRYGLKLRIKVQNLVTLGYAVRYSGSNSYN